MLREEQELPRSRARQKNAPSVMNDNNTNTAASGLNSLMDIPLHQTSGDLRQRFHSIQQRNGNNHFSQSAGTSTNTNNANKMSKWKIVIILFVITHIAMSLFYYEKINYSDFKVFDSNESTADAVDLVPSSGDEFLAVELGDADEGLQRGKDKSDNDEHGDIAMKLRLELDQAKRTILTLQEEGMVVQAQLRDQKMKSADALKNGGSGDNKRLLQHNVLVDSNSASIINGNNNINNQHQLVWNYETTGQPIEIKSTPSVNRDVDGGNGRPFFSIVMAAYNQGAYIEETVKSVAAQSYERWELIVVNDGSSDDSWAKASSLMDKYGKRRIRLINKRNGGLADARNVGMRYARGDWLCMLDSDDLLSRDYLSRAAELVEEDFIAGTGTNGVDIIPGCMRNFDAVSSDWCFPEGFSIVGVSHWNKFHASVLMKADLMRKVGGYDPGIPWGLEDWNFWLNAAKFNPVVRFIPEITFYYRHHKGTSMRKKMFAAYLEQTKAMVRTNHVELYEPVQLLHDHETIENMHDDTLAALEKKMQQFPMQPMPYFWRALRRTKKMEYEEAIDDLKIALNLTKTEKRYKWQMYYRLALLHEALEEYPDAVKAINGAFHDAYFNEILLVKHRLEQKVLGDPKVVSAHLVEATPTYWKSEKEMLEINQGTMAGKLLKSEQSRELSAVIAEQMQRMNALLQIATSNPCGDTTEPLPNKGEFNLAKNGNFNNQKDYWNAFGSGYTLAQTLSRTGAGPQPCAFILNDNDDASSGFTQLIDINQVKPEPILVKMWSKSKDVSGATKDAGYSLYVDIWYSDGSNDWGFNVPFTPGTHGWERAAAFITKDKAIKSLQIYGMLRGKQGEAWFDDVTVSLGKHAACACQERQMFEPTDSGDCEQCLAGMRCFLGDLFDPTVQSIVL